jgi:hypothetical protein
LREHKWSTSAAEGNDAVTDLLPSVSLLLYSFVRKEAGSKGIHADDMESERQEIVGVSAPSRLGFPDSVRPQAVPSPPALVTSP